MKPDVHQALPGCQPQVCRDGEIILETAVDRLCPQATAHEHGAFLATIIVTIWVTALRVQLPFLG